jgi:hypothetical protein
MHEDQSNNVLESIFFFRIICQTYLHSNFYIYSINITMSPSRVWNYFTRSADKSKATCNLCNQDFVFKNTTSNLLNHLNGKHPSVLTSETVKQTTMNLFVNSPKKSKADNETITQTIADMIVSDYLPLSLVEGVRHADLRTSKRILKSNIRIYSNSSSRIFE